MRVPKKLGTVICYHCDLPAEREHIRLTHRFLGEADDVDLDFCSGDCLKEFLYDESIRDEIERRVKEEHNWLHKQICPACRRRIT